MEEIRQHMKDINQLLLDYENKTQDNEAIKEFIQLKLKYIIGLVKEI